jgi:hypothetical protein
MRKSDEKKLVFKLDKILKKEFGTNLAFHEFSAGYGIADIVFASNFSFSKRTVKRTPLTNFNSLNIFLTLDKQKTYSITELHVTFPHLNEIQIRKQIKLLVNDGYLEKINKDGFKKIAEADSLSPIKKIIAIEVKLADHKGGLMQARRYQYFADESYLAILKEAEKNIDLEEFNRHNIGLILFDNKTNTIEIKYPKPENLICNNSVSLFAKEMMMSQYLIS